MNLVLAAHSLGGLEWLLGIVIVVGCLIGAAVVGYRGAWVPALVLLLVAVIAAYLLL